MKPLQYLLLCGAIVIQNVLANLDGEPEPPVTKVFATTWYHETPEFDKYAKAGIGAGFGLYAIFFIFALVMIVIEEISRHKLYNKNLVDARGKMSSLGLDIDAIDKEYHEMKKGGKDEDAIIEKAITEKHQKDDKTKGATSTVHHDDDDKGNKGDAAERLDGEDAEDNQA